ncbi:MAG: MFS transporter, partial [Gammaproteobacteria bacterium]|nr:MFS transporter [Gammaproteobacteria bacterium]
MPALPLAFLGLPLYVYLPAHYAAFPGIGLAAVGVVLLLARLIDLFTDPLVGLLADRSRHWLSPQWLMTVGGVLMLGGAWWLFRPAEDADALYLFAMLTITYL